MDKGYNERWIFGLGGKENFRGFRVIDLARNFQDTFETRKWSFISAI